jgi:phosphate transport system substrate-binding protein
MNDSCARITAWIGGVAVAGVMLCAPGMPAFAEEPGVIRIGGTGMALAAMQRLGEQFSSVDRAKQVEVLPSLGTPGGLRALADRAINVAVIGRSLTARERADGAAEAACFVTPLLFATSHPAPPAITKAALPGLYSRPDPTWPDGTPLKILLRSRAGSENVYLAAAIPGMVAALDAAYKLPGVPVATTDQENADLASRIAGSFAIMTLLQIRAERLRLQTIPLDGVAPTLDNVAAKTYPLTLQLCVVVPSSPTPAAGKFVEYLRSGPGLALMRTLGAMPAQ